MSLKLHIQKFLKEIEDKKILAGIYEELYKEFGEYIFVHNDPLKFIVPLNATNLSKVTDIKFSHEYYILVFYREILGKKCEIGIEKKKKMFLVGEYWPEDSDFIEDIIEEFYSLSVLEKENIDPSLVYKYKMRMIEVIESGIYSTKYGIPEKYKKLMTLK